MPDPTVTCPHCKREFALTESLAQPLLEAARAQYERQLAEQQRQVSQREAVLAKERQEIERTREALAEEVEAKVRAQCEAIREEEKRKAQLAVTGEVEANARELSELREVVKQRDSKIAELRKEEADLLRQKRELADARTELELTVEKRLEAERAIIAQQEKKRAEAAADAAVAEKSRKLAEVQEAMTRLEAKVAEAQKAEVDLVRKQRELDEQKRELELTVEKRLQEGADEIDRKARRRAEEETRLKLAEKDKLLADAQRQVADMKQRMEQGSQQLQGEVQELELEAMLRRKFLGDVFEAIATGERGADLLHRVMGNGGERCGAILWESKNTKHWNNEWLPKLRNDQRTAKADVAVIVSQALPNDLDTFDQVDGVWVTSYRCALPVAVALRHALVELASVRTAGEGQQTKTGLLYEYLTGPRFRQRVQAIVENFSTMQDDLNKERRAMIRMWAKREGQIQAVIEATAGMYGDMQGIAGKSLREIEGLEFALLGGAAPASDGEA